MNLDARQSLHEKGDTETAITILNNVIQRQENLGGSK